MPAALFSDAPVLAARRPARTSFTQVAVADWNVLPYWGGAKMAAVPPKAKTWMQIDLAQPVAKNKPVPPAAELDAQSIEWLMDKGLKDGETVRQQLQAKQAYFAEIEARYVLKATYLLSLALRQEVAPTQLAFTLTYDQSLHVRATLPQGALHVSVLFTPGLDPTQHLGQCEEEDNTVVSVFGPGGRWQVGTEGPLLPCLGRLPALLAAPAPLPLS
ncbi:MAG: hypothetical protein ACRYG7_11380 [Janthinobacterium lividum]